MMDSRSRQNLYILLFLLSILLAISFFPIFLENVLIPFNLKWGIPLFGNTSVDFFGAIVPTTFSFLVVLLLFSFKRLSWKRYLFGLALAVSFGLATSSVNGAIVVRFQLFDIILAVLVFFLVYFQGTSLRSLSLDSIVISKQNYLNSLLIIYSLSSFAILFVDLIHLPFANFTMQIGAAGLVDAIFLSGLFSFFPLTTVVALFRLLCGCKLNAVTRENILWWLERNLILVFLLLFLVISVPLILTVLVPIGLLSSDVGTDLTIEIVGIILTIFVINRLLHWNEDRLWKKVKNQVYETLGVEIYYIIIDLLYYIDLPTSLVTFGVGSDETIEEASRRNFFEKLDFVGKAESISMNDLFRKIVEKGGFGEIYSIRKKNVSNMELKYSRFLVPEILIPLINIQRRLHSLDVRIRNRQRTIQRRGILFQTEEQFYEVISQIVLMIFKDICRLRESGLKIYFE